MWKYVYFLVCFALSFALVHQANGQGLSDIALTLTNEVDDAGANVNVTVSIADLEGSSELTNFNLAIDFGSDNASAPTAGFVFGGATVIDGFGNLDFDLTPVIANFDAAFDGSGTAISLGEVPTDLFSLNFEIDPSVAPATTLPISIQLTPFFGASPFPGLTTLTLDGTSFEADALGVDETGIQITNGSITVPAIPEPTTLLPMLAAISLFTLRRKR